MKGVTLSGPGKKAKTLKYFDELIVPRRSTWVKVPICCYQDTDPIRRTADARNHSVRKSNQRMLRLACRSKKYCTDPGSLCRHATRLSLMLANVTGRARDEAMDPTNVATIQTSPGLPASTATVISAGTYDDDDTVSVHIIIDN